MNMDAVQEPFFEWLWSPILADSQVPIPSRDKHPLPSGEVPLGPIAYVAAAMAHIGTNLLHVDFKDHTHPLSAYLTQVHVQHPADLLDLTDDQIDQAM